MILQKTQSRGNQKSENNLPRIENFNEDPCEFYPYPYLKRPHFDKNIIKEQPFLHQRQVLIHPVQV